MQNHLISSLENICDTANDLLLETDLDDIQRGYLQITYDSTRTMLDMVISFPGLDSHRAVQVFSHEARSYLASIIGYAELMLDEDEGLLVEEQKDRLRSISATGKYLTRLLNETLE